MGGPALGPLDATGKTDGPCVSRCGTIKTPPCSKYLGPAEHRPINVAILYLQSFTVADPEISEGGEAPKKKKKRGGNPEITEKK
jgi:hypothetical protein